MTTFITVIVFILLIIAIPLAIVAVLLFLGCGGLNWIWKKIKNFFFWFFDPNFIFKDDDYNDHENDNDHRRGGFGNYNFGNYSTTPHRENVKYKVNKLDVGDQPHRHVHQWECCSSTKHNWYLTNGIPTGDSHRIDKVAKAITEKPDHTETKLNEILTWRARGAEVVYTSWNHWRCRVAGCNQTKKTEYYAAPCKSSGQLIIDLNDVERFKPPVVVLPVRREIAVEQMKRYS